MRVLQTNTIWKNRNLLFNLKLSNCLGFRWKDLPSITEIILLFPSFRNLTLGSLQCQWDEAFQNLNILTSPKTKFSLDYSCALVLGGWKWGYTSKWQNTLGTSLWQGDLFISSNEARSQLTNILDTWVKLIQSLRLGTVTFFHYSSFLYFFPQVRKKVLLLVWWLQNTQEESRKHIANRLLRYWHTTKETLSTFS